MAISFTSNPERVKSNTNREGDGVGRTNAPVSIGAGLSAPYYEVSVQDKPGFGSDQTITHTGPGVGVASGVGTNPNDIQGFVSATGNKIVIDNTFGSDSVTIQHHTGATIFIDADGSIHLISSGKKGFGVVAPRGDGTVYSKRHLVLKGDGRITLETDGDLDFNVGGNLGFHVKGDMTTVVQGSVHESIDGHKIFESGKDLSITSAGDTRITSAGKARIQSSKTLEVDVADNITMRTDHTLEMNAQKDIHAYAKEKVSVNAKDTLKVISEGAMTLSTKDDFALKADGTSKLSSTSAASIHSSSTIDVLASAKVNIKGSATDIQTSGSPSVDSAVDPGPAQLAQYAPSNTIIDSITSVRIAPDFPGNAKRMSAEEFSYHSNDGGNPNPKAEALTTGNRGAGSPPQIQDAGIKAEPVATDSHDLPAGVTSNGKSTQNPLPVPTSIYNSNQKISKHYTVGNIIGLRACPQSSQQAVLKEAMNTAWNILDPLVEKFGSRFQITSWYRNGDSANHITGGAVDLRASTKSDVQLTADIAAFIRDNLPYKQLFLEKNDAPGIHLHVWASPAGSGASGNCKTCADKKCRSSVQGLQLSFAVAALKKATGGKII